MPIYRPPVPPPRHRLVDAAFLGTVLVQAGAAALLALLVATAARTPACPAPRAVHARP